MNIQNTSKKYIKLLNDKGKNKSDPKKITDLYNKYFVNVGPNIDSKIPKAHKYFREFMRKLKFDKTFFLTSYQSLIPRNRWDQIVYQYTS